MASQIDGASKSGQNGLESDTDVARRIADLIATASDSLSQNVAKMKADLESFVSYLDNMQVKQEKSLLRKILGWLKYLFNALAAIFALGSCIAPLLRPVAPGLDLIAPAASALSLAAAELCKATIGTSLGMPVGDEQTSDRRFLTQTRWRRKMLRASSPCFDSSRRRSPMRHIKQSGHWHASTQRSFAWG
jgi:hypothetical protein